MPKNIPKKEICQVFTIEEATTDKFENFEDSLDRLGGFSWFQIWAVFLILLPEIPAAIIALMPIFVGTSRAEFYCLNPSYNDSQSNNETKYRIFLGTDPQLCSWGHSPNQNGTNNLTCAGGKLNGNLTPIFTSIVQEWSLICDRAWITDLFTSIQMLGMMTGAFLASQLADLYGRKTIFYSAVLMMGLFCFISGWSQDIYVYGTSKYFAGMGVGGFYVVYQIYIMEFLTPNWRTLSGCLSVWSVGIISLALMAYLLPSWRHLTWAASAPALLLLVFYPTMPESPRWLLCQERTEDAQRAFKKIARMNGKPALDNLAIAQLQEIILREKQSDDKSTKQSPRDLFKNSKLRRQLCLFIFGWFSIAFVYYGMSFNTKNLSGNPVLNVLYLGLVDLPAFPSGVLFNNWLGRRRTYAGYLTFASIFLVTLVVVDQTLGSQGHANTVTILIFLGRFGVAGAWGIVMCFTSEAFPTICRSTALGLCSLSANIGGVLAPQLAYLGTFSASIPYFIFAGLCLASVCSTWLLPETNKKLLQNFVQ